MRNVFKVISSIISKWMKTDIHNKDFARRFALKQRMKWTRKGPIVYIILLAGWVCIIDLPDCFGINLLSTFSDVFGQTRFIIFRSSVSLAFMFSSEFDVEGGTDKSKESSAKWDGAIIVQRHVHFDKALKRKKRHRSARRTDSLCARLSERFRRATEADTGGAYADFYSMDQLGLFLLSPVRGTSVSQGYPLTSLEPIYT